MRAGILEYSTKRCTVLVPFLGTLGEAQSLQSREPVFGRLCSPTVQSPCKWARQLGSTLGLLGTATDQLPGFNQVTSCFLLGAGFLQVVTEPGLPPVHLALSLSEVSWVGG